MEPFPGSSAQAKAEPASYSAMSVLDVESIKQRAAVDFLSTADVVAVLANVERESTPISTQPVRDPPSGTLVFYNRKNTQRFRDDGYQWRKMKGKLRVLESNVLDLRFSRHNTCFGHGFGKTPGAGAIMCCFLKKGQIHWC